MKSLKKLGYLMPFILPTLWLTGYYGGGIWNYATLIFAFVLIPILDAGVGVDTQNPEKEEEKSLSDEKFYKIVTFSWAFLQVGLVIWACYVVSLQTLQTYELVGFVLSTMTVTGGVGITVAHELGHKNTRIEQFLAKVILATVCYRHFYIEHNRGHHVNVATPLDPATSRKNQTFYAFWWQTVVGSIRSAWDLEKRRLQKQNLSVWHFSNEMWACIFQPILFIGVITLLISYLQGYFVWQVPVFFLVQSILGFSLLEAVNYIEHYGIKRKLLPSGKYQRVEHLHSWNASHLISNFFLFQLQRHSDHHAFANRRYQVLRHFEESPQLPAGYPTMILTALVPPLWFAIMNKRLEAWENEVYLAENA
ncbi:alkane 1-monooxygenase [bacterium 336/3]|nr:alkane 1-monooxygenase [bacterium 336/3]